MCSGVMLSSSAICAVRTRERRYGGVGVMIEQQLDHGGVGSGAGHDERSDSVAIDCIDVDVLREQETRDVQTMLAHGPVERGADLGVCAEREVRSVGEEELDDRLAAVAAGDLDGRATLAVGVDVGAFGDQEGHCFHVVAQTGVAQRSVANLIDHLQLR